MQESVTGAIVRSCFLIKDMYAPSSSSVWRRLFARRKLMTYLKLPGGRVTTDPNEMRTRAVSFYSSLFGGEEIQTVLQSCWRASSAWS